MIALVGTFNQEKGLVGAFSVITNLRMELFEALDTTDKGDMVTCSHDGRPPGGAAGAAGSGCGGRAAEARRVSAPGDRGGCGQLQN